MATFFKSFFKRFIFLTLNLIYPSILLYQYVCLGSPEKGVRSPGAGAEGGYELLYVGARN